MKVITTNLLNRFYKNGVKPTKDAVAGKLDASKVVASTSISAPGFVMDGKTCSEALAGINSNLSGLIIKNTVSNRVNVSAGAQSYTYISVNLPDGYSVLSVSAVAAHTTTLCGAAMLSGDKVYIPYSSAAAQAPETFTADIILIKTL